MEIEEISAGCPKCQNGGGNMCYISKVGGIFVFPIPEIYGILSDLDGRIDRCICENMNSKSHGWSPCFAPIVPKDVSKTL